MDAEQIRELRPQLREYLRRFADCIDRKDTRGHLSVYVEGQLSDLPAKSVEPIVVQAGVAVRTLQEFLSQHRRNENRVRQRLQHIVAREHAGPHAIGVIDETSDVKKGEKTPGVQRQWCGTLGKKENCIVTVHLAYATGDFHGLLDGELFLPEGWAADRLRCRAAGIPDDVEDRPKWQIALGQYDRAVASGFVFEWLTCDEGYGGKTPFLRELDRRGPWFVAEIPQSITGWIDDPCVVPWMRQAGGGRPCHVPWRIAGEPAHRVEELLANHPRLRDPPWKPYYVKDGQKGPVVWEVKHVHLFRPGEDGLPEFRWHLVIARNPLDHTEVKYFLSNAPFDTPLETLLVVAFSRWRVERCFEDHKGEMGLDQGEGRRWRGLQRHLILSCLSYLFLARVRQRLGKTNT
jgi:SRSO17 transposase